MVQLTTREDLLKTVRELREQIDRVVAEAGEERAVQPGSFDTLSLKDVIAHLTGWRLRTAARLEAGLRGDAPSAPWPSHLDDENEGDLHAINAWFYEQNKDKSLDQVMQESNETFDRVEQAIAAMSEDDLFTPGRFDWLTWTSEEGLGPAVVRGSWSHYYEEHASDIRSFLSS